MYFILWLALMIAFLVLEASTYALTCIWFAIGALGAAIVAQLGYGLLIQILTFGVVGLAFLLVMRPIALGWMKKGRPTTNVNSLVGKNAVVLEPIDNLAQTGKVRLGDVEWLARSENGTPLKEGLVVVIRRVEGVKLFVEPAAGSAV